MNDRKLIVINTLRLFRYWTYPTGVECSIPEFADESRKRRYAGLTESRSQPGSNSVTMGLDPTPRAHSESRVEVDDKWP